jgi:hypothetical protein
MKLKVESEQKLNIIKGRVGSFKKIFKKIDEGLSSGKLDKMIIYSDYILIHVKENDEIIEN